jgi:threonine dehydratase
LLRLQDFFEVNEEDICYWAQWLPTLLKVTVEPTSAVAMGGALQWLKSQHARQRVLVILSGGNIDRLTYQKIWKDDLLREIPSSRMRHSGASRVQ